MSAAELLTAAVGAAASVFAAAFSARASNRSSQNSSEATLRVAREARDAAREDWRRNQLLPVYAKFRAAADASREARRLSVNPAEWAAADAALLAAREQVGLVADTDADRGAGGVLAALGLADEVPDDARRVSDGRYYKRAVRASLGLPPLY